MKAFLSLGSIFLVVTGGEALYADMGHFGRKPIMYGWYGMVLPSLVLNYWGQGAFLMAHPEVVDKRSSSCMAPGGAEAAAGAAGHDGDRHRVAGADLRGVLAHGPGRAARLPAAHRDPAHLAPAVGPDLRAAGELGADGRVRRPGARVPLERTPRRRLRHRGHDDDGDHHVDLLQGAGRPVEVGAVEGVRRVHPAVHHRARLPRREHREDPQGRVVRPRGGDRADGADADLAQGSGARRRSHPPRRAPDRRGPRRGVRREARRRYRSVHVQGPRQGTARAGQQPAGTTRCCTRPR